MNQNQNNRNQSETNTNQKQIRDQAMDQIMKMPDDEFLWRLLSDSLPEFDRSEQGDEDYCELFRSTNHEGVDKAFAHKPALRNISTFEYVNTYLWGYDDALVREANIRDLAMELIIKMPKDEWLEKYRNNELPLFVRAIPGDPDYFDPDYNINPWSKGIDNYLDEVRPLLRVYEYSYVIYQCAVYQCEQEY